MATNKPRFSVTFSDDSFEKIKKYQKDHNINTQSKAVASLVEIAISEIESVSEIKKAPPYSSEAMKLAQDYDGLDSYGQRMVRLVADEEKARCSERAKHVTYRIIRGQLKGSDAGQFEGLSAGERRMRMAAERIKKSQTMPFKGQVNAQTKKKSRA